MEFIFVDTLGITTDLIALRTVSQPFNIHFYQHLGIFAASEISLGNGNDVSAQFSYFFNEARLRNSDLVLTPEYSCPWNNVIEILNNEQMWPQVGKLWALGCESITPEQLVEIRTICDRPGVFAQWEVEKPGNNKHFYDPLVYLFRGNHNGNDKLIVLVQFKTMHMGARVSAFERDHLIEGTTIWILKNQGESHRFISIICSEAMNFSATLTPEIKANIRWNEDAYYVYHPQANPDPTHEDFIAFRKFVLSVDRKEIIALNWNSKSTLKGKLFIKNGTSRSGVYTQSSDLDLSENRIKANHSNGLYYFSFGIKNHAFLLNSFATIFLISQTSILISGVAMPQARRDGPLVIGVKNYSAGIFVDSFSIVSDDHIHFLGSINCGCNFLMQPTGCVLQKERLICLTCGELKSGLSPTELKSLMTFSMKQDTESNFRITVEDDLRPESQDKKTGFINAINIIVHDIIPNKDVYPESIIDLRDENITIGFDAQSAVDRYRYNVIDENGNSRKATIVYLNSSRDFAIKKTFDNLQSLFDSDSPTKRRVVVFFRRGDKIIPYSDPKAGSITYTDGKDGANILNTLQ